MSGTWRDWNHPLVKADREAQQKWDDPPLPGTMYLDEVIDAPRQSWRPIWEINPDHPLWAEEMRARREKR